MGATGTMQNTKTHLRHDHQLLLDSLLDGKLPRNLGWSDVIDLIGQLGHVETHKGDASTFVVGPHKEIFNHSSAHELDVETVSRLRTFLKAAMQHDKPKPTAQGLAVVVVDHHAGHIYRDLTGSKPTDEATVRPYDPFHYHHHLVHRKEAHYRGERVPEENEFYEEIAKHLSDATQIVLIGHGTGTSSAVTVLSDYLRKHHSAVFARVLATETADLSALTEAEIDALAKKHLQARA